MMRAAPALLAPAFLLAASAASAIELGLPAACTPGEDCLVVRYVDHDPESGYADYRCGGLTSDGHSGTDIALPPPRRMADGVDVRAAAGGVVVGVRDGMPNQPEDGRPGYDYGDRNCGNGVTMRHDGDWETQYCHMTPGSVVVRNGDRIEAGARLGSIGMSGEANFPHVHFSVRRGGADVDPFTGTDSVAPCGAPEKALWLRDASQSLDYQAIPIADVGLTDHIPDHPAIVAGLPAAPLARDRPLVGYILGFGAEAGDRIVLRIFGPDDALLSEIDFPVEERAPRFSRSGGRRAPEGGWPAGTYRLQASVERDGQAWTKEATADVTR